MNNFITVKAMAVLNNLRNFLPTVPHHPGISPIEKFPRKIMWNEGKILYCIVFEHLYSASRCSNLVSQQFKDALKQRLYKNVLLSYSNLFRVLNQGRIHRKGHPAMVPRAFWQWTLAPL